MYNSDHKPQVAEGARPQERHRSELFEHHFGLVPQSPFLLLRQRAQVPVELIHLEQNRTESKKYRGQYEHVGNDKVK